jgi:hypothetical protein
VSASYAAALPSPLPSPLSTAAYDDDISSHNNNINNNNGDHHHHHPPFPAAAAITAAAHLSEDAAALHAHALSLARAEAYGDARLAFERLLSRYPRACVAWTSYAQMEKRAGLRAGGQAARGEAAAGGGGGGGDRFAACRAVLQRGLALNPTSACLVQAWGLMELQKNNAWAAVRLLERGAALDPRRNSAVLRWVPVRRAAAATSSSGGARGGGGGGEGCDSRRTA